jgi:endonuclease/exonuclease/phosphatase family metal-dependent hydrolase
MSARPRPFRSRARRAVVLATTLGAVGAVAAAALLVADRVPVAGHDELALSAADAPATQPPGPTRFRVSTLNLLGYGHTMKGGRKGFADGRTRQRMADQLIRANGLEIVGFQEMEPPQIEEFNAELGSSYELWPGFSYTGKAAVNVEGNSIAWRRDKWVALQKTYYDAPYFKGANVPKPIVLLQNRATGQQVYVTNTHNPANTFGNAQTLRNQSVNIQARTFNGLRAQHPGVPIVFTGDMNDRSKFFCRITARTSLRAANGGTRSGSRCTPPPSPQIDWIMGTPDVVWSGYQQLRTPYIKKATDHPLIWADATVKPLPAQRAGIEHVVVLDLEGLPSAAVSGGNARYAPHLRQLMAAGAATLDARTDHYSTVALPNLVSMLSGRPAAKAYGGHGVTWFRDKPHQRKRATTRGGTGRYVPTLFDAVHDWGGSTSFMSADPSGELIRRSYDGRHGAKDGQGVSYGRSKLSVSSIRKSDTKAARVLKDQIRLHPRSVSVVQLSNLRKVGQRHGFLSPAYQVAVRQVDKKVASIWSAIRRNPRTARSTLLVVTSDSGGHGRSAKGQALTNYQVPFVVWGNGVPAGTDLYRLNPAYRSPGSARVGYVGPQPIRTSDVANLVTGVLGYVPVPRSRTRTAQDFNVFVTG